MHGIALLLLLCYNGCGVVVGVGVEDAAHARGAHDGGRRCSRHGHWCRSHAAIPHFIHTLLLHLLLLLLLLLLRAILLGDRLLHTVASTGMSSIGCFLRCLLLLVVAVVAVARVASVAGSGKGLAVLKLELPFHLHLPPPLQKLPPLDHGRHRHAHRHRHGHRIGAGSLLCRRLFDLARQIQLFLFQLVHLVLQLHPPLRSLSVQFGQPVHFILGSFAQLQLCACCWWCVCCS
mmetsp:Transcript_4741/g.7196  ORF Transcript_4741/g.7196 Transcript_4741/m.7196 type:complete len:233 (+) Transcript_4741:1926-2624(+)